MYAIARVNLVFIYGLTQSFLRSEVAELRSLIKVGNKIRAGHRKPFGMANC